MKGHDQKVVSLINLGREFSCFFCLISSFYVAVYQVGSTQHLCDKSLFAEEPLLNMCFVCSKSDGQDSPLVEQFIARKADILFCPAWKTATHQEEEQHEEEDAAGVCWFDHIFQALSRLNRQI